ncbi:MAG TPA: GGDEF domain-containing protein [Solirubrobacteraceae bacterium]|nr:GGDEF domain-containing protein [Solirubrobacteraceae bacterium]
MNDELRLRTRMIGAGVALSVVLLAAVAFWVAETWSRPHRGGLLAMVACAGAATAIIAALPHERIVLSRWREPFFLAWSLSLIVFITIAAGLDAGVRSPVVLMLFLTLVYAALSYPRWLVAVVSAVSLLAVLLLSQVGPSGTGAPTNPVYLIGLMLTLAVTGVMCVLQARLQEQARTELGRLSRSDALTGCLNRLGFNERMAIELARGGDGGQLSLIVLDFDGFKTVNDDFGHSAGDELLCWAGRTMREVLRPGDALGRLGGDEFAALLPGVAAPEARQVADRLRLALSARIGACAGVAGTPDDGLDLERLHHTADERLYASKRARPPLRAAGSLTGAAPR